MANHSKPFRTPTARFSFVHNMFERVVKKTDSGEPILKNGKPVTEQQCTLIFDKSVDMSGFQEAIREAIVSAWGESAVEQFKNKVIRSPILPGDGKEARIKSGDHAGEIREGLGPDKFFVRVATRLEAPVHFRSKVTPAKLGNGDDEVKSGDYGFAVLHAYAWENAKNGRGVSFGIDYLQKTKAGESLGGTGGGSVDVESVYEAVEDTGDVPAETKTSGKGAASLFD